MLQKNELYNITTDDLTVDGNGIGKIEGMAIFVAGMLPGESGVVRIIKLAKSYAVGKLIELTQTSGQRVTPACPVFARCGGCSLMHLSYPAQLDIKHKRVIGCIRKIGKSNAQVLPPIGCEKPLRYRNKTAFPVRQGADGLKIGCFKMRTHEVIDVEDCLISSEAACGVLDTVRQFMQNFAVSAYDEVAHKGIVRHIIVRESSLGQVMAALVINADDLPHKKELIALLKDKAASICLNINKQRTNAILSQETRVIYGRETITENILGLNFEISLNSFLQINHAQMQKLYSVALDMAGITDKDTVADLYCGAGTISLIAAKRAKQVYGIEIVPSAVENANKNAQANGITNARFLQADCKEGFNRIIKHSGKPDVIIVDPPRKGLDEKVIRDICEVGTDKVVYVSCDPATLARDIAIFEQSGYKALAVQPVDMFPHTLSIENVALLINDNK